jgi:Na+-translocating ferredoxin:NAD+ oxidoreductase RNF subunit RnfB
LPVKSEKGILMGILLSLLVTIVTVAVLLIAYTISVHRIERQFFSRFDSINRSLPGINCGACGYKECLGFAESVVHGLADPAGCVPGGPKTAYALADILGATPKIADPVMAAVHCKGGTGEVKNIATYRGIEDCHAAVLINNGVKACIEGCLGLGSCVRSCRFGALSINENKVAVVDRQKCNGCGACLSSCPRNLLSLFPHVHKIYLACANHESGDAVSTYCTVGCTACEACVKVTPTGAIAMRNNLPELDYFTPSENFVGAAYKCPSKCFVDLIKVRPKANIDTKCDGCGDCVAVCPVPGAITGQKTARHVIKKEICIGCGRCLAICHVRAISMWGSLGYESKIR